MVGGLALGSEIKRFARNRMTRIAVVVLMLMPLTYGALYLWAYWDPFGHVNKLPVALVNSDRGTEVSGEPMNVGTEIAGRLTDDASLDWHVVDDAEARDGVAHGKYYFMLELPPDFSEAIASPTTGNPRKAQLIAEYNDANNYISSSIGRTAVEQVLNAVSTRISGQAVNQVLSVITTSGAGIKQAADGANKLSDGATQLDTGAGQLVAGLDAARSGSAELAVGSRKLSDGINTATDPLLKITNLLAQIGTQSDQVNGQVQDSSSALAEASDELDTITGAQDAAAESLNSIIDNLSANQDPVSVMATTKLRDTRDQLLAHQRTSNIQAKLDKARATASAGGPVGSALTDISTKGKELTDKLTQLRDGAKQVASGNAQLNAGIATLDDGARQLKSGTAQLNSGSHELATKLTEGAQKVPDWTPQQKDAIAETIGGPVQLTSSHENSAPNFGTGMAPFFLTLALFFGAMLLWMAFRPLQARAIAAEISPIRVTLASYLPAVLIGIPQAVILYCVVRFALHVHAEHPVAMLGFMILASCAFIAVAQAISALLGPVLGKVLLMTLLMLQLVSAGGLYPVETTTKPFQALHWLDPMTYGVNGLRQLILGGIDDRLWQALIFMVTLSLGSILLTSLAARRNQLWNLTRLVPSIKM
ncbi:YhgE/Pip domain-containing protein [Mycobacterium sp. NBC_00419]|uniref:YhgE/Pip domain-containing protein n=1 Tax=Mycobacterium sp. NBC_00419 TaxID=2975989 RepID=UPI002E248811